MVATVLPMVRAATGVWVGAAVTVGTGVLVGGTGVAGAQPLKIAAVPTVPTPMTLSACRLDSFFSFMIHSCLFFKREKFIHLDCTN